MDQLWVKDDSKKIKDVVAEAGKKVGADFGDVAPFDPYLIQSFDHDKLCA